MRENFFLHEVISNDDILPVIICSTIYSVYLIIIFIILFCEKKEYFCKNNK